MSMSWDHRRTPSPPTRWPPVWPRQEHSEADGEAGSQFSSVVGLEACMPNCFCHWAPGQL